MRQGTVTKYDISRDIFRIEHQYEEKLATIREYEHAAEFKRRVQYDILCHQLYRQRCTADNIANNPNTATDTDTATDINTAVKNILSQKIAFRTTFGNVLPYINKTNTSGVIIFYLYSTTYTTSYNITLLMCNKMEFIRILLDSGCYFGRCDNMNDSGSLILLDNYFNLEAHYAKLNDPMIGHIHAEERYITNDGDIFYTFSTADFYSAFMTYQR